MSTIYIKNKYYYYAHGRKGRPGYIKPETTGISITQFGKREAERLAREYQMKRDQQRINGKLNHTDDPNIIDISNLPTDIKLEIHGIINNYTNDITNEQFTAAATKESLITEMMNTPSVKSWSYEEIRNSWLKGVKARGTTPTKKRTKVTEGWLKKEQTYYNVFSSFVGKDTLIKNISLDVVQNFIDQKSLEGKSGSTIAKYLQTTGMIFTYAIKHKYYPKDDGNPVYEAEKPDTEARRSYVALPHRVVNKTIAEANDTDKIFWTFLKHTGLNPADISSLTPDMVIERTTQNSKKVRAIVKWRKKTRSSAKKPVYIVLNDAVCDILDKYGKKCFGLYPSRKNRNDSTDRFKAAIISQGYKDESDLKTEIFSLGCLRHSNFTYRRVDSDASLEEITHVSGHNSTEMLTDVYIKDVNWDRELELANAIDK